MPRPPRSSAFRPARPTRSGRTPGRGSGKNSATGPARKSARRDRHVFVRRFRAQFPPIRRMDLWHPDTAGCGSGPVNEQSLFIEALEKEDPAERAAFLDRVCAGVSGLRERLERLLARHVRQGSGPEEALPALVATIDL